MLIISPDSLDSHSRTMAYRREPRPEDHLREELRECQLQLVSVQRNYDGLSRLMQSKNQEVEQVGATSTAWGFGRPACARVRRRGGGEGCPKLDWILHHLPMVTSL